MAIAILKDVPETREKCCAKYHEYDNRRNANETAAQNSRKEINQSRFPAGYLLHVLQAYDSQNSAPDPAHDASAEWHYEKYRRPGAICNRSKRGLEIAFGPAEYHKDQMIDATYYE